MDKLPTMALAGLYSLPKPFIRRVTNQPPDLVTDTHSILTISIIIHK